MKILHVWDIGADSYLAAIYQRKFGHVADVIKRAGFDPYGITEFYGFKNMKTPFPLFFYLAMLRKAKSYDVMPVHFLPKAIPILKKLYPKKKILLHYHGSDVRYTPLEKRSKAEEMADIVLVSTPDLKEFVPNSTYIPNPIDIEHFSFVPPKSKKAFTILLRGHTEEVTRKFLANHGIDIEFDVLNSKENLIPYAEMPKVFSQYGTYIDLTFRYNFTKLAQTMGNLGRQALARGLTVLNYKLEYVRGLPEEHKPDNVAKKLLEIYENL